MPNHSPMRIRLAPDRRAQLLDAVKAYFCEEFDDDLKYVPRGRPAGLLHPRTGAAGVQPGRA